ncbi:MAG: flavodoxin family protein [Caldilinea sp. CFX5]|nr:flavodoxin family protein [Caldilinea sp. CFX5]
MKALVIYDSAFGNTAQVAQAIGAALGNQAEVVIKQVRDALPEQLRDYHLLVVGSPTQGFRPTAAITTFLKRAPTQALQGVKVAAFDTRIAAGDIKPAIFRFIVKWGGYAAKPIAELLQQRGGELVAPPEGFYVEGKEGPLKVGELERADHWAKQLVATQVIAV